MPISKFDDYDILVFYPEPNSEQEKILENINTFDIPIIKAKNPYWQKNGIFFEDFDGYKIMIANKKFS